MSRPRNRWGKGFFPRGSRTPFRASRTTGLIMTRPAPSRRLDRPVGRLRSYRCSCCKALTRRSRCLSSAFFEPHSPGDAHRVSLPHRVFLVALPRPESFGSGERHEKPMMGDSRKRRFWLLRMSHVTRRKTSCSLSVDETLASPSTKRGSPARDSRVWVKLGRRVGLAGVPCSTEISAQGPPVWAHQRGPRAGAVLAVVPSPRAGVDVGATWQPLELV